MVRPRKYCYIELSKNDRPKRQRHAPSARDRRTVVGVALARGDAVLPVVARRASHRQQAAGRQQQRHSGAPAQLGQRHHTGRAKADREHCVAKAGHAVDMAGDALAGLILVDDQLKGERMFVLYAMTYCLVSAED